MHSIQLLLIRNPLIRNFRVKLLVAFTPLKALGTVILTLSLKANRAQTGIRKDCFGGTIL